MTRGRRIALLGIVLVLFTAALALKHVRSDRGPVEANGAEAAAQDPRLPRLVDLGSDECVPCKMMAPILKELKREYEDRMAVEVIDVRVNRSAGVDYGIKIIPTQIFFSPDGQELFRHEGFMSKEDILAKWKELGIDVEGSGPGEERG